MQQDGPRLTQIKNKIGGIYPVLNRKDIPQLNLDKDFKYKEITEMILNAAFEVHNTLGCGFLEKVYENALVYELRLRGYKVEAQKGIQVNYKGQIVGGYISDLIIEDKIVIELKTVEEVSKVHKAQLLNYLKATGYEVGLVLNFAKPRLEYKRLIMTKDKIEADKL